MPDEKMLDLDAAEEKAEAAAPAARRRDEESDGATRIRVIDRRHWARRHEDGTGGGARDTADPAIASAYVEELKDDAERRRQEARELERRLKEVSAAYQELQDDMERLRSRGERESDRRIRRAKGDFLKELLPVLDGFDRALANESPSASPEAKVVYEGMRMIHNLFAAFLRSAGAERFAPLGEIFDPRDSEAVEVAPVNNPDDDNRVIAILAAGYKFEGELLRPAQVRVGKAANPPARKEDAGSNGGGEGSREIQVKDE